MIIKIKCPCGSNIELNYNLCFNESDITCSNCNKSLPGNVSSSIKDCIYAWIKAKEEIMDNDLYEIQIKG